MKLKFLVPFVYKKASPLTLGEDLVIRILEWLYRKYYDNRRLGLGHHSLSLVQGSNFKRRVKLY